MTLKSLVEQIKSKEKRLEGFVRLFEMYLKHMLNVLIQLLKESNQTTIIRCYKPRRTPSHGDNVGPSDGGHPAENNSNSKDENHGC